MRSDKQESASERKWAIKSKHEANFLEVNFLLDRRNRFVRADVPVGYISYSLGWRRWEIRETEKSCLQRENSRGRACVLKPSQTVVARSRLGAKYGGLFRLYPKFPQDRNVQSV